MKKMKESFKFCFLSIVMMIGLCSGAYAQKTVTGTITDERGEEIIGANVQVKGTTKGTVSDLSGHFSIDVPESAVLVISYIGYQTQEIPVANETNLLIQLKEEASLLDEVVVVGYGTMKKSDLTGAVASANLKDFEKSPNTNIVQSLQGTVPGLNIGQITSAGATPSIDIRGKTTLSGNTNVLIILDGVIYTSSLSSINPNDIESIDVLKDASASAIYGAQAANGVLLITSKKGAAGKAKVSFSSSYSISNPTNDLRTMNRAEYIEYTKKLYYDQAYSAPGYTTPNPDFDLASVLPDNPMRDANQPDGVSPYDYDWWSEGTQTGSILENRLSISGGTEDVSYLISLENVDQKGYIVNDNFKRNSIRVNLDAKPYKWAKLGVQAFGSFVNQDGAEPELAALRRQNPLITPYDDNGDLVINPFNTVDQNPFLASEVNDKERHNYFFANLYTEINLPLKGLTYRLNFGNNYRRDDLFRASEYAASLNGEAYKQHRTYHDYTVDNILNYNNTFGDHGVAATLLYGASEREEDYTEARATHYERLNLGYNSLELGTERYATSDAWNEALLYQMARVNYKYKDRYLLTATARRDGFSGFAENNKTAVFPSVALAWILSEEDFFKVSWVDYLKIRGGWGVSGNLTGRYSSLASVTTSTGYIFGDGGDPELRQQLSSMSNEDLKWEKTAGFNGGVDFYLFNNRLTGSIDAYQTETTDLLWDLALPSTTGFTQVRSNIGKIKNYGFEFILTSRNIVSKDFEWSTTFNFSTNKNEIVTLLGIDKDGDGVEDKFGLSASNLFIGESTSAIYNYAIDGIWQLDDNIPAGYRPGNYKIRDVDVSEDGTYSITADDRVILGSGDPAYRFGMLNKLRYKCFTLSFFINSVQGGENGYLQAHDINYSAVSRAEANHRRWNMPAELAANYWSPSNPDATFSLATGIGATNPLLYQSRSFIRLQDVNLSCNLPHKWLNPIGVENLDVFINGKNLITITDYMGWDPEAGQHYNGRPVLKSFTLGLNITF
jgi:TonB-linked SusC/RagA family outer membrane protein